MSARLQDVDSTESGKMVLYVIESDAGLLISTSHTYGHHLPYWHSREVAEEMCKLYEAPLPQRVSEMDILEFYGQLLAIRKEGMAYVLMDKLPDGSARIVPIDEAICVYGKVLSDSTPYRHSSMDEFVRILDSMRSVGVRVETEDEYLPVDCPICGKFFSVHESAYRQWRDGMGGMLCPYCLSSCSEATFGRVGCDTCEAKSGFMPLSLCRCYTEPVKHWRCQKCCDREAEEFEQKRRKKSGVSS